MPPRHFSRYLFVGAVFLIGIVIFTISSKPSTGALNDPATYKEALRESISTLNVPFRFTFQKSAHKPPQQKNSTHGDSSWYSDWTWQNPFSSSVTLDEERIVLPPLHSPEPAGAAERDSLVAERVPSVAWSKIIRVGESNVIRTKNAGKSVCGDEIH